MIGADATAADAPRTMPRAGAHGRARAPRRSLHFPRAWRARRARLGSGGRGAARRMTCRPPLAEVGSEPGGDRANLRRRARGDAAAQGAPEPSVKPKTSTHPVSMDELIA